MGVWAGVTTHEGDFKGNWGLSGSIQVICSDELVNSAFPSLSSSSDAVALYDTSSTPIEICRAAYSSTTAGRSVEFDTNCTYLGDATGGVRGAYSSAGGDIGSPGDEAFPFNLNTDELAKIVIYPNPASSVATIKIPETGYKTVRILNSIGQTVYNQYTSDSNINIDAEGFHNGVFLVQIQTLKNEKTLRLVIQH